MVNFNFEINNINFSLNFSFIPKTKKNILFSISLFRLNNSYRPFEYYMNLFYENIDRINKLKYINNYNVYLLVFYDESLINTKYNKNISDNNKNTFIKFLNNNKNKNIITCYYNFPQFRNKIFHIDVFGMFIRWLPFFNFFKNIMNYDICIATQPNILIKFLKKEEEFKILEECITKKKNYFRYNTSINWILKEKKDKSFYYYNNYDIYPLRKIKSKQFHYYKSIYNNLYYPALGYNIILLTKIEDNVLFNFLEDYKNNGKYLKEFDYVIKNISNKYDYKCDCDYKDTKNDSINRIKSRYGYDEVFLGNIFIPYIIKNFNNKILKKYITKNDMIYINKHKYDIYLKDHLLFLSSCFSELNNFIKKYDNFIELLKNNKNFKINLINIITKIKNKNKFTKTYLKDDFEKLIKII